jgi:eukaryotic-like serine/threonine-protein kinase
MERVEWDRLEELFERAQARPAEQRRPFLAGACGGDPSLQNELEAMLEASGDDCALAVERLVVDQESYEAADPLVGMCLGPWRLTNVLGRGGMGSVYRGQRADGSYRQEVAIKLVRIVAPELQAVDRFRTERQVLAHLVHPNIASLLDGGFAPDGTPYLVMELVDGVPITDWCSEQRLSLEERLRLFCVVCDAVQHAHRSLIVHRDLKPSNILVSRSGDVKLLDFGIAKLLDPGALDIGAPATRAEVRILTPEYAAPEQRQDGPITTAADVYALGVLLYELLTGVRPCTSVRTSPSDAVRRMLATPNPGAARRLARRIRGDLDRIVLMALRDEPERRYGSAGQLREDIERFLDGRAVLAQPDTVGYRMRKFVGRNRLAVAASTLLVTAIAVFGSMAALQARALAVQGRAARLERDKAERVVGVLVQLFEATNPAIRPDGDRMPLGEFLDGAETRALEQLEGNPAVRARLQQVFGLIHFERGKLASARAALEDALAEQRRLAGSDDPEALESLHALGVLLQEEDQAAGALALLQESLDRHRRVYGDAHEKTARALYALAPLVGATDRDRARQMIVDALSIQRRVLPNHHPDLASTLGALALSYKQTGDLNRSRELYLEALAAFRTPGERHNRRALSLMSDYASLLGTMGDDEGAEAVQRQTIALGEQTLGRLTLPVANLINNHAVTLASLGRLGDSERAFIEAFDLHRTLLGDTHWRLRNVARNIALVIGMQGRENEALPWLDRAVSIRSESPAAEDPGRMGIRAQRALVLFRVGRREEALAEVQAAIAALRGMKDTLAPYWLAHGRANHGRMLLELDRASEAEPLLRDALAFFDRFRPDPRRQAEVGCLLGWARTLQGAREEGAAALEQCLPVYRAWGQADRRLVAKLDALLAGTQ